MPLHFVQVAACGEEGLDFAEAVEGMQRGVEVGCSRLRKAHEGSESVQSIESADFPRRFKDRFWDLWRLGTKSVRGIEHFGIESIASVQLLIDGSTIFMIAHSAVVFSTTVSARTGIAGHFANTSSDCGCKTRCSVQVSGGPVLGPSKLQNQACQRSVMRTKHRARFRKSLDPLDMVALRASHVVFGLLACC